ncbi:hypothetical protein LTS18_008593, partial [Coniosporium uncinatum]
EKEREEKKSKSGFRPVGATPVVQTEEAGGLPEEAVVEGEAEKDAAGAPADDVSEASIKHGDDTALDKNIEPVPMERVVGAEPMQIDLQSTGNEAAPQETVKNISMNMTQAARARRARPKAVDMFADSDEG